MSQSIYEFKTGRAGFTPDIVGKRFAGKQEGTWRQIIGLDTIYWWSTLRTEVRWVNERGREGKCFYAGFISWCRKPALVLEDTP